MFYFLREGLEVIVYYILLSHLSFNFFQARKMPTGNRKKKCRRVTLCISSCKVLPGITSPSKVAHLISCYLSWGYKVLLNITQPWDAPITPDQEDTQSFLHDDIPCLLLRSNSNTQGKHLFRSLKSRGKKASQERRISYLFDKEIFNTAFKTKLSSLWYKEAPILFQVLAWGNSQQMHCNNKNG